MDAIGFKPALVLTTAITTATAELARTQDKLEHCEAQLADLEQKKTAAEVLLHRTQYEIKEAQDLVNSTKKHSAVLQETLTVRTVHVSIYCTVCICMCRLFAVYNI